MPVAGQLTTALCPHACGILRARQRQTVQRAAVTESWFSLSAEGLPTWLEAAAGNPHTYDAPDATRRAVCVRILPGTYERLRLVQRQAKLRTLAGAWEFLMRLGLAVAERLPRRM